MKRSIYLLIFLFFGSLIVSCKKDLEFKSKFDKSYKAWQDFRKSSDNSYRYSVHTASWTGASSQTIITVKAGKVVRRSYIAKMIDRETNKPVVVKEWNENQEDINTHDYAASPITLDEVYHKAKTDWLKKRDHADTYFETKNQGMISSCGYIEKGCQDDCFIGVSIDFIEKI